jgi:N-acetylglucosaminyldiphosphoundecaprenol N-acetyl-beta-D-mannosaminyltransferase
MSEFRQILGIRFYAGDLEGLLDLAAGGAGLIAVPSAPVLARLSHDAAHAEALEKSDFAITDSGLMVILWLLFQGESLRRISGLRFLKALLQRPELRDPGVTFWVMPTAEDARINRNYLRSLDLDVGPHNSYVAPIYARSGPLEDAALLRQVEKLRPKFIVICLGGGAQERLGYYLRRNLPYRPTIACTGAAIGFFSGRQAHIPAWGDRLMLGWLFRTLHAPSQYFPRYCQALALIPLLWRHGARSIRE